MCSGEFYTIRAQRLYAMIPPLQQTVLTDITENVSDQMDAGLIQHTDHVFTIPL